MKIILTGVNENSADLTMIVIFTNIVILYSRRLIRILLRHSVLNDIDLATRYRVSLFIFGDIIKKIPENQELQLFGKKFRKKIPKTLTSKKVAYIELKNSRKKYYGMSSKG